MADISFDDLIPKGESNDISFDDLIPEKEEKGRLEAAVDVFEDVGKGIGSGLISIPQGIMELGAIGVDYALNTNTADAVSTAFESIRPEVEGTAGKVTEDIVAFGVGFVPVAGWLGRAGQAASAAQKGMKVSKAGRGAFGRSAIDFGSSKTGKALLGSKKGLIGSTAVGALGYSTAVATDGRTTMSDNFEILPDFLETEKDKGLTGRQEASRRLRNKLRTGVEDMFVSGAVDTALTGLGAGARAVGRTETGFKAAKAVREMPGRLSTTISQGLDQAGLGSVNTGMKAAKEKFVEYLTPSGGANQVLYETTQDARAVADMSEGRATKAVKDWEKATKVFLKGAKLQDKTPVDAQQLEAALHKFLLGDRKKLEEMASPEMIRAADSMIAVRSDLEDDLIRQLETEIGRDQKTGKLLTPDTPAKQKAAEALEEILRNQKAENGYLRRQFEQYTNPIDFYKNLDLTSKEFDNAVDEVARHIAPSGQVVDDNIRANAKQRVLESLGISTLGGLSPERALKAMQESVTKKARGDKFGLVAKERPILSSVDDIFVAREPLIDASPNLRKLKGELTSPIEIYTRTISDMAQANAAADMYRAFKDQGLVVDAVKGMEMINAGGRPSIIDVPDSLRLTPEAYDAAKQPFREIARNQGVASEVVDEAGNATFVDPAEQVINAYKQQLTDAGYIQLGESRDIQHVFGGSYGDLTGRYVSPETYGAITAPIKFGSNTILGEPAGILSQLRSLSQKMTIVPNPGAQVRNIAGNFLMLGSNANLGRDTDFSDMFKVFTASVADLDDAGLSHLARKISLAGVEDTSLVVRALKEYRRAGEDMVSVTGKIAKTIDLWQDKIPFMQTFEKIYSDSDSFFKGLALLGEEKKLLNAFKSAGIDPSDTRIYDAMIEAGLAKRYKSAVTEFGRRQYDLLPHEVLAADVVKDTMPIYPRIGKAVRALDMLPIFGNFTSFASENIRNSANILTRGVKEMSFEMAPDMRQAINDMYGEGAAETFEKQIRGAGAQRLMSYASVASIAPTQAVKASMYATGTTQEQMDALKSQLPDYMDGHQLIILNNDGNGKIDYIDLSYVSPYAFVLDPARAALQIYGEKGKLDKSQAERIFSGAMRGLEMFAEPFGEESLIYERVRDILPSSGVASLGLGRGGKNQDGVPIYNETDDFGTAANKSFGHLLNGIIPSYAALFGEFDKPLSANPREAFNQGRVTRAITGTPGGRGETYNGFKEAARLVTGFTPMRLDMQNDFAFAGKSYTPRRTEAKSAATRAMKQANLTKDDMLRQWDSYLDNLYREQSKLYNDIQAARTLGLSDTDIRRNLVQGAKLGKAEANAIMNGEFWPTDASSELWKELVRQRQAEGRTFMTDMSDFSDFNQKSRDRMRESLSVASPTPVPSATPAPDINFDDLIPQSQPQPEINFDDLIPQQQGSLPTAPAPVQTASAQVNPIVLGNDPATQALAKALGRSS